LRKAKAIIAIGRLCGAGNAVPARPNDVLDFMWLTGKESV
jgi:hypothetical protein